MNSFDDRLIKTVICLGIGTMGGLSSSVVALLLMLIPFLMKEATIVDVFAVSGASMLTSTIIISFLFSRKI